MSLLLSREMQSQLNRLFDDGEESAPRVWAPLVDICESESEIIVQAEVPGVKKDEIEVQLTGQTLRLSGERQREKSGCGEHFHRLERQYGAWQRTFQFEVPLDAEKVSATYEDGVLTVRLGKKAVAAPRRIEIEAR